MTQSPDGASDESALDELFDHAVECHATGRQIELESWLQHRPHLLTRAEQVVALAGEVASGKVPVPPRSQPRIAGFTLLAEAGRGGMGTVYRARQDSLDRVVALKILSPALVVSARARDRFVVEAQALARLRHPCVVTVHEVLVTDGLCAYAMEWIDGPTLAQAIAARDPRLAEPAVARLGADLARALAAVHAAGLVHRDVKPANVLLGPNGRPLLSDFGLVHDVGHDMHTSAGEFLGTAAYAAPEQLRGERERVGPRSDVYALGVTLYVALTGQTPFGTTTTSETLRRIELGSVAPLRKLNPRVPRDFATIVATAMDPDPDRRYASATALADDLERFLASQPIHARPAGLTLRARRWIERNPWLAAALLLLAAGASTSTAFAIEAKARAKEAAAQTSLARQHESDASRRAEENARLASEKGALAAAEAKAREEAQQSAAAAERRAAELAEVLEFQKGQWAEVDIAAMGVSLRRGLLERAQAEHRDDLAVCLDGINFSSLALDLLAEQLFDRSLAAIKKGFAGEPLVKARLLHVVAVVLKNLGMLDRAEAPQAEALQIQRQLLGDDHHDTLRSIDDLGVLLAARGQFVAAETLHREGLDSRRRLLGNDDPRTIKALMLMGVTLGKQQRHAEAEPYDREALARARRVLGDHHEDTLTAINNVGTVLTNLGRLHDAEPFLRDAYAATARALGDDASPTLSSAQNLGALLARLGKDTEAEALYRAALRGYRRTRGDDHPDTLAAIDGLGIFLGERGRRDEGEALLREALTSRRELLGEDHPDTLVSKNNFGCFLVDYGKLAEAEPLLRDAVATTQQRFGGKHPQTLRTIESLVLLLVKKGEFAAAEPLARMALSALRASDAEDARLAKVVRQLALILHMQAKLDEAAPLLREAWDRTRRELGESHHESAMAALMLGSTLARLGRHAEAIDVMAEAEPSVRHAFAARGQAFVLATFLQSFGRAHAGLGDVDAFAVAEAKLLEAHALATASQRPAASTVSFVQALAGLYQQWQALDPTPVRANQVAEWQARLQTLGSDR